MSHIVEIQTQVRDKAAIETACRRLHLEPPTQGVAKLFSGQAAGTIVKLPGWKYPTVFDTQAGTVRFDNYEGRWGDQKHLDRFLQAYAVEKTKIEARRKGHAVSERHLADGGIQLTVSVGGAA